MSNGRLGSSACAREAEPQQMIEAQNGRQLRPQVMPVSTRFKKVNFVRGGHGETPNYCKLSMFTKRFPEKPSQRYARQPLCEVLLTQFGG